MAYATIEDLTARYGDRAVHALADRDADGKLDTGVVDAALADASEEMDTYLVAGGYTLPLSTGPRAVLARLAVDIAVYRLSSKGALMTDDRRMRYEDAVKFLSKIATRAIRLDAEAPAGGPPPGRARAAAAPRVFSRRTMGLGGGRSG